MITFVPLVSLWVLAALAVAIILATALALWGRLRGWGWRLISLCIILAALSGPVYQQEDQEDLPDIVFVVVDKTASQSLGGRTSQVEAALPNLQNIDADIREIVVEDASEGSLVAGALTRALAEVPVDQVAGAVILSDGQVQDAEGLHHFPAPVHVLLTGRATDWDRRLVLKNAPTFGIVGEEITLQLRINEQGAVPLGEQGKARISISVDGADPQTYSVDTNVDLVLPLKLPHGGLNVVHFIVEGADGELTTRNNEAVVQINGVRDRLRVLLVSGEPYAGERIWRNLLKADTSVDLVHFTILRPPEKQDGVPVSELSLIAFPTRELFLEKLDDFDLVIFDRYRRRGILPPPYLANIAAYVERGGAVLVATGPAYASAESLYRSPLQPVLPVRPSGRVVERGFVPQISDVGTRHPVTRGLRQQGDAEWGRWFRQIEGDVDRGDVVMTGALGRPLLVLDRVGEGRIATLMSDQAWLWSRGVEGGGPQLELLRRLAHWMMKEPELEEEQLNVTVNDTDLTVNRQSLSENPADVTVISPSGETSNLPLTPAGGGVFKGNLADLANGVYRLSSDDLNAVAIIGAQDSVEFRDVLASDAPLMPLVENTSGGVIRLEEVSSPMVRNVRVGRVAHGPDWIGITPRDAYRVLDIRQIALLPLWAWLLLASTCAVFAWLREGR